MYSRVRLIAGSLVLFLMSAVVLVPISNATEATPTSVMKHDNFEEVLWTSQSGEECPISFEEIREIWRGELLRARLKDYGMQKEVVGDEEVMPTKRMRFYISCADHDVLELKRWLFLTTVDWVVEENSVINEQLVVKLSQYAGIGDGDYVRTSAKGVIEEAITKYLEANLD